MDFLYRILGIAAAVAEETGAVDANGQMTEQPNAFVQLALTMVPMLLIFVVFYFFMIRPQRKKEKQVQEMLNNLKVGDRICTIGGIYGTIKQIKEDSVMLTVGKQDVTMWVARWGIRSVEEVSIENDAVELN